MNSLQCKPSVTRASCILQKLQARKEIPQTYLGSRIHHSHTIPATGQFGRLIEFSVARARAKCKVFIKSKPNPWPATTAVKDTDFDNAFSMLRAWPLLVLVDQFNINTSNTTIRLFSNNNFHVSLQRRMMQYEPRLGVRLTAYVIHVFVSQHPHSNTNWGLHMNLS